MLCLEITALRLYLDNFALSELTQTRELGIILTVNDSLSPTSHVMDIVSKLLFCARLVLKSQDVNALIRALFATIIYDYYNTILLLRHPTMLKTLKLLSGYSGGLPNVCEYYENYSYPVRRFPARDNRELTQVAEFVNCELK